MPNDPLLHSVFEKVRSNERIGREEGIALFHSEDILGLGRIANWIKEKKTGSRVTYVVNRQINPTNLCVLSCRFCDFASKKNRPKAYEMSVEEVLAQCSPNLKEVHIVGGLHAGWPFSRYLGIVRAIHEKFPQIQIKAYTAVEMDFFSRMEKRPIPDILLDLKEAGLSCLPGGGAEVFSERVRKALFPFKIGAPRWLEIHRAAHQLGIRSNATLLYGHMETVEERVDHILKLRDLQDETGGFLSFIPLAYQPGNTKVVDRPCSAIEDLRTIAVARILLDNFEHIKSYWVTIGEETAALALQFGADDLDGTIGQERIMHAAEAGSPLGLARERLERLILSAGRDPVERDALYNRVGPAASPVPLPASTSS